MRAGGTSAISSRQSRDIFIARVVRAIPPRCGPHLNSSNTLRRSTSTYGWNGGVESLSCASRKSMIGTTPRCKKHSSRFGGRKNKRGQPHVPDDLRPGELSSEMQHSLYALVLTCAH